MPEASRWKRVREWFRLPSGKELCARGEHEWPMWITASSLQVHCLRPGCHAVQDARGHYAPREDI
jgi:hypothetical protein